MELSLGETPNGLSANGSLQISDGQCQFYFWKLSLEHRSLKKDASPAPQVPKPTHPCQSGHAEAVICLARNRSHCVASCGSVTDCSRPFSLRVCSIQAVRSLFEGQPKARQFASAGRLSG